ncbi:MAG: extracellular solute-binding protein [Holosporales bacterium]|jgi:putrescine transport system substrate-binding protein|nr:extracellular solute-binding protein [Holosporales bacterium]
MGKKIIFTLGCLFICLYGFYRYYYCSNEQDNVVCVCSWCGVIPPDVFEDFEKETGIKIVYDAFGGNDVLEAKSLAGSNGYDVIFPSFIPYVSRGCLLGLYNKLDKTLIPNLKNIEKCPVTEKWIKAGGNVDYAIPFFWGTIGLIYNESITSKLFPNIPIDYKIIFDLENLKKISEYGVCFPEEYIDVFPQAKIFWKISGGQKDAKNLKLYKEHLKKLRKYIRKFSSNTIETDFELGEICIAISSSDNAWRVRQSMQGEKKIKYILPKEGGILWVDCAVIPVGASHIQNAYKFLNFLLRPEVAARITNNSGILTNVCGAAKFYNKEIKEDVIYLTSEEILRLSFGENASVNKEDIDYTRLAVKAYSEIKWRIEDD